MFIRPENYRSEYQHGRAPAGRSAVGPEIGVELTDDGDVRLWLEPTIGETLDDRDVDRSLIPNEARELAAMLEHYADRADHRAGLRP